MKAQRISFQSFMSGSYKKDSTVHYKLFKDKYKLYSFISPTTFFDGGTTLLIGAGAIAILFAVLERHAAKYGDIARADHISLLGNVLLQGGGIAFALYLLSHMALIRWL